MTGVFVLLVVYQIKHFLADYPLQTPYMLKKFEGGTTWIKPLAAHAGIHALFTFAIALLYGFATIPGGIIALVAIFDFVVHFAMDRIKASPELLGKYKALSAREFPEVIQDSLSGYRTEEGDTVINPPGRRREASKRLRDNTYFWWALGLDQMVHHLTHYIIIGILVSYGG